MILYNIGSNISLENKDEHKGGEVDPPPPQGKIRGVQHPSKLNPFPLEDLERFKEM